MRFPRLAKALPVQELSRRKIHRDLAKDKQFREEDSYYAEIRHDLKGGL